MKRRRKNIRKKHNFLVIGIIASILLMSSGYAVLTSVLNVTGAASAPVQDKLNNRLNVYASPWYTQIVTAHSFLSRTNETLTDGNTLITTFTPTASNNTTATLAMRFTFTNRNMYTLTGGVITTATTDCKNATIPSRTISTTSIAYNATMTFNTQVRLRTSQARNCQFNYTIRYQYSTTYKYFYYTIQIL